MVFQRSDAHTFLKVFQTAQHRFLNHGIGSDSHIYEPLERIQGNHAPSGFLHRAGHATPALKARPETTG